MSTEEFKNKYFKTTKEFEEFNDKIKKDLAVTEEQMKTHYGEDGEDEMLQKYMEKMRPYYEQNHKKVVL